MRTVFSRLFLVGLIGVAIFAVVRLSSGSSRSLVAFERLDPGRLAHTSFALDATGRFAIDAMGSYEEAGTPASDTTLAAYGWIVRREDRAVVWILRPPRPDRGTLVGVRDTISLGPGTYDAYFTSHGDPLVRTDDPPAGSFGERLRSFLSRGGRAWVGDAGRWRFLLTELDEPARRARRDGFERDPAAAEPTDPAVVWQTLGVHNHQRREALLQVHVPSRVALRTVTEITDGVVADRAALVRLGDRDTVWTTTPVGRWAGGSLKNRIVEAEVALAPGVYRVSFEADRSHAYDDWTANPPLFPWEWGLTVRQSVGDVSLLDPTDLDLPRITAFECVGPDETRRAEIDMAAETDVLLVAVGEVDSGSGYDVATLERRDDDGDWDDVWEMDDDTRDLAPAGGASKNRRAVVALTLEPGTYRLSFETDGSHDCVSGYNSGGPPDGDLWGVILYALDPDLDLRTIPVRVETPSIASDGLAFPDASRLLARIDSVEASEDRRVPFQLAAPADVWVVAMGEMSDSQRYDYATIERAGGGVVWEMTWQNTSPGGDKLFHRRFEGAVPLDAGSYVLRYRSDDNADFGDFGPDSERLWGVHVYRSESSPPPPPPRPGTPTAADGDLTQPELIGGLEGLQSRVQYPESARRDGIEGEVLIHLVVTEKGQPTDIVATRSPDPRLAEAAIAAVRESQFSPARRDGQPVRALFSVPVTFRLR